MFRKIVGKCPVCGDPAWITSFFAKKAFCTNDPEHRPQLVLGWHSPRDLAAPPAPEPTAAPADDLERECADADRICAALGLTVEQSRTDGGSLNVPRIIAHISETLTALRESHAFGVAMTDKYIASQAKTAPEPSAAPQGEPVMPAPIGFVSAPSGTLHYKHLVLTREPLDHEVGYLLYALPSDAPAAAQCDCAEPLPATADWTARNFCRRCGKTLRAAAGGGK